MRQYLAYNLPGIYLSRLLVKTMFKNCRAHWVRDVLAGNKPLAELYIIESRSIKG